MTKKQQISLVLIISLLGWTIGFPGWVDGVSAARLQSVSDTLTDSDLSAPSNHTVEFTTPSGVAEGETITITFPAGFSNLASISEDDIDLADDSIDLVTEAAPCSTASASYSVSGQVLTFEICAGNGGAIAADSVIEIEIGTNATAFGSGVNQITNPGSSGSFLISIDGTMSDFGRLRVAIIDDVFVTARVNVALTFTIEGVAGGISVNGDSDLTASTSTATLLAFGDLASGSPVVQAQQLSVSTNAKNGFSVTVVQDHSFRSSTSAVIDNFADGASTSTPIAWAAPTADDTDPTTFGHIGFTSEDSDLNSDEFGTALYAGNFQNPRIVFSHTGPANGISADRGRTRVGYKVEISDLQEADDYSMTLTYVATAVF